ncbi:MAG: sulfatase-like hydrolase/transferase, partial [Victivallales bacterium]|nr:sulfatase-like hydrolase/transferase [Victivallales bacterium]
MILTDDQGYGDLSCHGNPWLRTPELDRLHGDSVRLTDFHVDPMCAPTRAALLTGRYSARTGVWSTLRGRYIMNRDETTMAEVFAASGYATGMFGKWHLGDSWPYRPFDRGFQESLSFGGGVVGEIPDHWDNDYFHAVYERNGVPERFDDRYCTDVWFDEATA